jgi:hypothetical protein
MTSTPGVKAAEPPVRKRQWAPRIWEGCDFFAWVRLLARNRFAVHWSCLYIAVIITFVSFFHLLLRLAQQMRYGLQIARTRLRHPPLFILGHWRTGTTLLHELLILDPRHNYPTTYECLEPNHFLLTEGLVSRFCAFLIPSRRPMDNMAAGFNRPQEDEFALCMMGQPSPYLTIAFPNRPPQYPEYLDLEGLKPRALASWKRTFLGFLKRLTFKDSRRLVLKSPPHTARLKVLREMFPDALYVHIVRDPYVVFPSTVKLWKTMYQTHGLQRPTFAGLDEQVFTTFLRMYDRLEEGRRLIAPSHFYQLRYEDLVHDPIGEMRKLYEHLGLGGFEELQPHLESYLASVAGYETNRYDLSPELRAEISRRWAKVIERYGYRKADEPGSQANLEGDRLRLGAGAH